MDEKFRATGYFANRGIMHFAPVVKDGEIDAEMARNVYGLNDAQLPLLAQELESAGLLKKAEAVKAEAAPLPSFTTAELEPLDQPEG